MSRGRKVEVKCERCKTSFMARVADRKRGWGKFCSKSCKAIKQERRTGQFRDYLHQRTVAAQHAEAEWNGEEMEFANAHLYSNEDKYGYSHGE